MQQGSAWEGRERQQAILKSPCKSLPRSPCRDLHDTNHSPFPLFCGVLQLLWDARERGRGVITDSFSAGCLVKMARAGGQEGRSLVWLCLGFRVVSGRGSRCSGLVALSCVLCFSGAFVSQNSDFSSPYGRDLTNVSFLCHLPSG